MTDIKEATLHWQGTRLNFAGQTGSGYAFNFGSPAGEEGGSPMELLLASVAGCTAMDVVSMLRKQRQKLTAFAIDISGERAPEPPQVYTQVQIRYTITGQGISSQAVERAIELSKEKYCSASIMFKRAGAEVSYTYEIIEG